ncbi:MAG: transposase [Planctomycetes bacterium]|nr:transposase [Planctomycetota bacterium]
MRFNDPIGFFFTWTTYGTWLHGDDRWSVNRKGETIREKFLAPNLTLERTHRSLLKHGQTLLSGPMRRAVREAIERDCEHRGYVLRAVNVRTNHAHMVVLATADPARILNTLKAWATRALREAGLVDKDTSVWTKGGSRRWLWNAEDLAAAADYVINGQGPDLPEV